ncbi:hypothetical protein Ancab_023364 [Ancistrocladus abbreviatus]
MVSCVSGTCHLRCNTWSAPGFVVKDIASRVSKCRRCLHWRLLLPYNLLYRIEADMLTWMLGKAKEFRDEVEQLHPNFGPCCCSFQISFFFRREISHHFL